MIKTKIYKTGIEISEVYDGPAGPAGDEMRKKYKLVNRDGVRRAVDVGTEDIQGYIQSFRDTTSIESIIRRLLGGDVSILHQREGLFGDFTSLPQNIHELHKSYDVLQQKYLAEPDFIKKQFPTFDAYFAEMYQNDGKNYLQTLYNEKVKKIVKDKENNPPAS